MAMLLVIFVALLAAGLTLFSGFGLGSLLLPAFAPFFPLDVAVAATAVVHLANNLFKAAMLGKFANMRVVLAFGIPGMLAAFGGAWVLKELVGLEPVTTWTLADTTFAITPVGLTIGVLILFFALFELNPKTKKLTVSANYLPLGGLLSGFLGGLSGHQGALRSTFMVRLGLTKEAFLGSNILCAVMIDIARLSVYFVAIRGLFTEESDAWKLVLAGTLAAFLGSYIGRRMIEKMTMDGIRKLVGIMLTLLGLAIATGLVGS